jgi:hypothetical protein
MRRAISVITKKARTFFIVLPPLDRCAVRIRSFPVRWKVYCASSAIATTVSEIRHKSLPVSDLQTRPRQSGSS